MSKILLTKAMDVEKKSLILMEKKYKNRKRNYTEIYKQKMEKVRRKELKS